MKFVLRNTSIYNEINSVSLLKIGGVVAMSLLVVVSTIRQYESVSSIKGVIQQQQNGREEELSSQSSSVAATSSVTSFEAKFDEIRTIKYEDATYIDNSTTTPTRARYSLDQGWERGSGGLDDADRQTILDLYYNATSVFEWGLGESTKMAAKVGVPRYAGIDSDVTWVGKARDTAAQEHMGHFRFYFADIGATIVWGRPKDKTLKKIFYDYTVAPLTSEFKPFDVYMVDGRFRIACACIAFLHALKYGADMDKVRVAVHDNDQNRFRHYQRIMNIADIVIKNQKLWVYKLNPNTTEEMIMIYGNSIKTHLTEREDDSLFLVVGEVHAFCLHTRNPTIMFYKD